MHLLYPRDDHQERDGVADGVQGGDQLPGGDGLPQHVGHIRHGPHTLPFR
jgi:hypothetical protein